MIFTDETSVKLGETYGSIHVTRTKNEEWKKECCEKTFSGYSTFIFWGAIALNWKGPCHVYQKGDPQE